MHGNTSFVYIIRIVIRCHNGTSPPGCHGHSLPGEEQKAPQPRGEGHPPQPASPNQCRHGRPSYCRGPPTLCRRLTAIFSGTHPRQRPTWTRASPRTPRSLQSKCLNGKINSTYRHYDMPNAGGNDRCHAPEAQNLYPGNLDSRYKNGLFPVENKSCSVETDCGELNVPKNSAKNGRNETIKYGQKVINLSDRSLNEAEKTLLCKGLKFCPTQKITDAGEIKKELDQFHNKLRTKEFLAKKRKQKLKSGPRRSDNIRQIKPIRQRHQLSQIETKV